VSEVNNRHWTSAPSQMWCCFQTPTWTSFPIHWTSTLQPSLHRSGQEPQLKSLTKLTDKLKSGSALEHDFLGFTEPLICSFKSEGHLQD